MHLHQGNMLLLSSQGVGKWDVASNPGCPPKHSGYTRHWTRWEGWRTASAPVRQLSNPARHSIPFGDVLDRPAQDQVLAPPLGLFQPSLSWISSSKLHMEFNLHIGLLGETGGKGENSRRGQRNPHTQSEIFEDPDVWSLVRHAPKSSFTWS